MEEKLKEIYNKCIEELRTVEINIKDNPLIGNVDIKLAKRDAKRYGCCKQEEPDKKYYHIEKRGRKKYIKYDRFKKHHIEISKWVLELDEDIIKNTVMHEIIHCLPNCNNHGKEFKKYANYINKKLGYDIKTVGNKEEDYKKSNLPYKKESNDYKYKIICKKCGQVIYRKRLKKDLIQKYICSKCGGKLNLEQIRQF